MTYCVFQSTIPLPVDHQVTVRHDSRKQDAGNAQQEPTATPYCGSYGYIGIGQTKLI